MAGLSEEEREAAAKKFQERHFPKGKDIVTLNTVDTNFYIIKDVRM